MVIALSYKSFLSFTLLVRLNISLENITKRCIVNLFENFKVPHLPWDRRPTPHTQKKTPRRLPESWKLFSSTWRKHLIRSALESCNLGKTHWIKDVDLTSFSRGDLDVFVMSVLPGASRLVFCCLLRSWATSNKNFYPLQSFFDLGFSHVSSARTKRK